MNAYELFSSINEPFAAGLFELEGAAPPIRHANALKRFYETAPFPPYAGGQLFPTGKCMFIYSPEYAVRPHYSNTFCVNYAALRKKSKYACEIIKAEEDLVVKFADSPHTVGGMGWTHAFPNYSRVLKEGLNRHIERVHAMEAGDLKEGLLILLEGIKTYHTRCLEHLRAEQAPDKLIRALERMPYEPANNLYEALVSLNFSFYLDGCDDIGPLDRILADYEIGDENLEELLREFFRSVDQNNGWSGTLGPDYNEITRACLRAIHNGRRPNLQLLVTPQMPDWVWEESVASLSTSCGQPAFYNLALYQDAVRKAMPHVPEEDLARLAFGGCTETMFEGLSCVGSDDAGLNVALIFSDYLRTHLTKASDFEEFYAGLIQAIRKTFCQVADRLNEYRRTRAKYRPDMIRTLLIDDCLENQTEYNAGGARYVHSVINIAGVVNVIDSLNVLKALIFDTKQYAPEEFLTLMDARDPKFLHDAKQCPSYGNDNPKADLLGERLLTDIVDAFDQKECYPRGKFYAVSNQFTTYVNAGRSVPATPDGRATGDPLADSMGAIHGNDYKGATALLNSVAALKPSQVLGTPITNIRISKKQIGVTLKPLVTAFFEKGGMQLQVSCLSREEILDAMEHPENYSSLVVRVGGFSEYFTHLTPKLQQTVLERTEH